MTSPKKIRRDKMRGASLLLCLFALLLVSAIGFFMLMGSDTETRIDANYGSGLSSYYAARSGLEEVRDRVTYPSSPNPPLFPSPAPGGIADKLPQTVAGTAGGVLYVVNPANGEIVDPTDSTGPYFDDQLCHDYDSGIPSGTKCTATPAASGWNLASISSQAPGSGPLGYKWVRINLKTNRIAAPFNVDATAPPDSLVCWDGQSEQVSPSGANPACDANGMQNVYMLSSLGITPGFTAPNTKRLLRSEIVAPSIRPPGAITMSFAQKPSVSLGSGIPNIMVDGHVHGLDGKAPIVSRCSSVAAMATDSNPNTHTLEKALNDLRLSIVNAANQSCNADGSGIGNSLCPPGLWWVRGTDTTTRFVSTGTGNGQGNSGQNNSGNSGQGNSQGNGQGNGQGSGSNGHNGGHMSCDSSTPNCYLSLDLSAPQLMAIAASYADHIPNVTLLPNTTGPFAGNSGNQADVSLYQPTAQNVLTDEIVTVQAMVAAGASQPNYFGVNSSNLQTTYGSVTSPAIVVMPQSGLTLNTPLTGYGVLVVPSTLVVNNNLQWTGIVLVTSSGGQFTVSSGASGSINGALLLQSGAGFNVNVQAGAASNPFPFHVTYSCDAIDLAFQSLPFKVIAATEWNY